jgi:hypothetical protein
MSKEKDQPAEHAKEADAKRKTHAEFMEELRSDSAFEVLAPSGEAFIIGGQSPAHPKPVRHSGAISFHTVSWPTRSARWPCPDQRRVDL